MRERTSVSQACGSQPFIFAVYAAQRTMPKGAGDDQLLRRVAGTSQGSESVLI
jgi:hypothetical protein